MSNFDFRKVSVKPSLWTHTGVGKVRPKVQVTPDEIEQYASDGLGRREIAKKYRISYQYLNKILRDSYTLTQAFERGKAKAENKI
jgi:hypothetical protein